LFVYIIVKVIFDFFCFGLFVNIFFLKKKGGKEKILSNAGPMASVQPIIATKQVVTLG
jgi:hypothetical protein